MTGNQMGQKDGRHDAIRSIVRGKAIRTQGELARELQLMGFASSSGTVARDVEDVGLVKVDGGFYALEGDMDLWRVARVAVRGHEAVGRHVALSVDSGAEMLVSGVLNSMRLPGVVCATVGGGAVLVTCLTEAAAGAVAALIGLMS